MVLDDSCIVEHDLSKHVMGKVNDFLSIPNMYNILKDEGFLDIKLSYLGGTWVLIEFDSMAAKEKFLNHSGVNSWFEITQEAINDFSCVERIVWVDIEGVPLNAWSKETFDRIGKKWGKTLDMEDNSTSSFSRKRVCVMTNYPVSILETFKIIVKGRVFMVRAKELFTWSPVFATVKEEDVKSDDESLHGSYNYMFNSGPNDIEPNDDGVSDDDAVSDTVFGSNASHPNRKSDGAEPSESQDQFGIYDLLNKKKNTKAQEQGSSSPSLSHPPGFTPAASENVQASGVSPIKYVLNCFIFCF
ncbi:RNA-directed DNA polymerase, eukaryota [Tanacetum coccineum]|uniref:RNA-directed DNA polymerase, eukaryota n=1 Tax=Tanacetum coccineum TaxID=301880 RepID=A0ABQ5FN35_9ASTR